jgi:hypothetical protein
MPIATGPAACGQEESKLAPREAHAVARDNSADNLLRLHAPAYAAKSILQHEVADASVDFV